jgi:uncharacterized protein YbaR (Trm112 family)
MRRGSLLYDSLLEVLRCPACVGQPRPDPGQLEWVADKWFVCQDCERKYPIRDRVPVMLIEEGDKYRNTPLEEL